MYIITILILTILIPSVQSAVRPTIQLTFSSNEQYLRSQDEIKIQCELLNPNQHTDQAQLWYVDLKTGKSTLISRSLLTTPTEDSPDVFKNNRNKRYVYIKKNQILIRGLQMEDSARYECNCPDCEEPVGKQTRELHVMKIVEPKWSTESAWPLHENTKANIKCYADDFYPYVGHRILRDHHDITNEGKSSLPNNNIFPQKFTWNATITPTAEWHNSTLRCTLKQGNTEQHAIKTLEVLYAARFGKCEERQYVDSKKDQSTIECSYSGNPPPKLTWLRRSDEKLITFDTGVSIETKDENHGRYKSIVTFDRTRLAAIPLTTTASSLSTTTKTTNRNEILSGENYYQHLLNNGFIVKLTVNGNEKATRLISIVRDKNDIRSKLLNQTITIKSSSILLTFLFIILHLIQS